VFVVGKHGIYVARAIQPVAAHWRYFYTVAMT